MPMSLLKTPVSSSNCRLRLCLARIHRHCTNSRECDHLCTSFQNMASLHAFTVSNSTQKAPPTTPLHSLLTSLATPFKPLLKEWKQLSLRTQVSKSIETRSLKLLDAFVDSAYKFAENPVLNDGNFGPVAEIGEAVLLSVMEGEIPDDFPEGVYIRNGPNPLYLDHTAASSLFGLTECMWYEGDGMLHATYFNKHDEGQWRITYKNRYVETETYKIEKERNRASFIPATDGHPYAILAAFVLNMLRFGKAVKDLGNTNVFEHAGRVYAITENHLPYEINITNLDTLRTWDVGGAWDRPFTSHSKKAPQTGELVTIGVDVKKPHYVLGVISADGKTMLHKVDLQFETGKLIHEVGVTENYNIIMDYPLMFGFDRTFVGKHFMQYDNNGRSKIGVMPRFGDAESICWFDVKNHCSFHIINSFEDGDEIVVRGCRTLGSVIPGPGPEADKTLWYRRAFLQPDEDSEGFDPCMDGILISRAYEWRLNMKTGAVKEGYLTRKDIAMDFPAINNRFVGLRNKYAYTQVVDSLASSKEGLIKSKMFAKLYFDEQDKDNKKIIKVEYHVLEDDHFCSGVQFVEKEKGIDEDDGWLICYVHDERANVSKVYIIDAKKFTEKPVAEITLPQRVPYGFHGIFMPTKSSK